MGVLSGSRKPSPSSTGLGPTGFDPERMADRIEEQDETIGMLCEALEEAAKWSDEAEAACAALGTSAAHITGKLHKRRAQKLRAAIIRACDPSNPNL